MKVLFLDIDGVLNNSRTQERCLGFLGVDKKLARRLSDWLGLHKDVEVVLSSTWRTDPRMWYAIKQEGIDFVNITENSGLRRVEISNYIQDHPEITKYAILDDQDSEWFDYQRPFFVQTDEHKGLTETVLKKLDQVLGVS